jgi:pimeloyl-ACP methyl ester carboxylesterase
MPARLTFVPGTMCDRRVWAPVWRALGYADDPAYIPVETRLTREAIRAAFDEAAADGPMNLVAFSMGGYLSLEYALDHPTRVRSLVTVCSSAFGLSAREKADRARAIDFLSAHAYRGIGQGRINQFVHPSRQTDPAVAGVMRDMDRDLGVEVLKAQLRETSARDSLEARLAEIACPVLLIGADGDQLVAWSEIARMHDLIAGGALEQARDAGHMLPLEQPDWLAQRIAAFHAG